MSATIRQYAINAQVASSEKIPPSDIVRGSFLVAASDAARNYAGLYLPDYEFVSIKYVKVQETETHGLHTLWKAEVINHEKQLGAVLWVREL